MIKYIVSLKQSEFEPAVCFLEPRRRKW